MRKTWKSRGCHVTDNSLWRHAYGHQNCQCVHFPLTTFSKMGFLRTSGVYRDVWLYRDVCLPWCLALPWAFRMLVCRKSLSFLDLGDPSSSALVGEKTELKISYWRGIAPSPLCRSYTLPVPLCWQDGGWAERGHNRITGGWVEGSPVTDPSNFPSIRKRLALFEHIFRRTLSHHAFRWQHWQLRLTMWIKRRRRGQTEHQNRLFSPLKNVRTSLTTFYNQIVQTSFDFMVGLTAPQHQSLYNRMAFLISSNSLLTLISWNHSTPLVTGL